MTRTRIIGGVLALSLLTACGDDGGSPSAEDSVPATTGAAATTAAAASSSAASTTAPVPAETIAIPAIEPGADPEVDAVVAAYSAVFDSSVSFDDKAAFLQDAEMLHGTVDAYAEQGERFGGINVVPTSVTIVDQEAALIYDVYFGDTKQDSSLPGSVQKQGDVWTVTRVEFCNVMAAADTPCPS
ncbi:MAG: hypothetical protein EHM63_03340 [Actinobacteria bacterium]|nr:MAG: hypothetical protein EHM63_03340 [Actinomycetota bacterium]